MAGKTVSAHVSEEIVRRIEQIAQLEARPVSQIVAAAVAFYTRLPAEAHQSLRTLEAFGGEAALDAVTRGVARAIVAAAFDLTTHRVAAAIPEHIVAGLDTEEDILAAAVRLTAAPTPAPAAAPEVSRRRSRRERAA